VGVVCGVGHDAYRFFAEIGEHGGLLPPSEQRLS
jgi:hypothetical protein